MLVDGREKEEFQKIFDGDIDKKDFFGVEIPLMNFHFCHQPSVS